MTNEPRERERTISAVALDVHSPTGSCEVKQRHARRLTDLNGKTICELSNGSWDDQRTFPFIRKLLQSRFPGLKIVPFSEFPIGSERIDNDSTIEMLLQKGCDALITGNAA